MTIAETFREFIDHARLHGPCKEAVFRTFEPGRERYGEGIYKYYCPIGAAAFKLGVKKGL